MNDKGLLKGEMKFFGKHAVMIKQLKEPLAPGLPALFETTIDLILAAGRIGAINNRTGKKDRKSKEETSIFAETIDRYYHELTTDFRLIMLLHGNSNGIDPKTSMENAFLKDKQVEERKNLEEIYYGYILGGIEIISEEIFGEEGNEIDPDTVLRNAYKFIQGIRKSMMTLEEMMLELGD